MPYHLVNTETFEYYFCDDEVWISALKYAEENDWQPAGTYYDFVYDTDDICFDIDDQLIYLYTLYMNQNDQHEWDGNYTEKRNQIVTYEDILYLPLCLKGSGAPAELIEFIEKGCFRICSE